MRVAGSTKALPHLALGLGEGSTRAEDFHELYALLRSKGYSDQAAQVTAISMLAKEQPMASMTARFAGISGTTPPGGNYSGGVARVLPSDV